MDKSDKKRVGLSNTALHHKEEGYRNAEKDRVRKDGKQPLRYRALRCNEKDDVLTDKRKNESDKKLKSPIRQHVFAIQKKPYLKCDPSAPYNIDCLFTVFKVG